MRITWDEYSLRIAEVVALRSEDPNTQVGCVLLRHDHTIASVGYNGVPKGTKLNWHDRQEKREHVVHAETNALRMVKPGECISAAITHSPCIDCLKQLAAYGVKRVIFRKKYQNECFTKIKKIAKKFKIQLVQL